MKTVLILAQLMLAVALMWSCFCRLVHTDDETRREVRWSFWFMFVAAGFVLGAPVMPLLMPQEIPWAAWTTPRWVWLALLASMVFAHVATARFWSEGALPKQLNKDYSGGAVLASLMVAVGLAVAPPAAFAQQPSHSSQPVHVMEMGDSVTCMEQRGCIAMTFEALEGLKNQACHPARNAAVKPGRTVL